MSVAVVWEFSCDRCADETFVVDGARSQSAAWKEAKAAGWKPSLHGYTGHFCPRHGAGVKADIRAMNVRAESR